MHQTISKNIFITSEIVKHNSLTAIEFSRLLGLKEQNAARDWLGCFLDFGLVQSKGRTKGTNRWGQTPKLTFHELIKKFRQAHYPVSRWREIAIVYDS